MITVLSKWSKPTYKIIIALLKKNLVEMFKIKIKWIIKTILSK